MRFSFAFGDFFDYYTCFQYSFRFYVKFHLPLSPSISNSPIEYFGAFESSAIKKTLDIPSCALNFIIVHSESSAPFLLMASNPGFYIVIARRHILNILILNVCFYCLSPVLCVYTTRYYHSISVY